MIDNLFFPQCSLIRVCVHYLFWKHSNGSENIRMRNIWRYHQKRSIKKGQTTIAKVKRTKQQTMIYKTLHIKLNNTNPNQKLMWTQIIRKGIQFMLH